MSYLGANRTDRFGSTHRRTTIAATPKKDTSKEPRTVKLLRQELKIERERLAKAEATVAERQQSVDQLQAAIDVLTAEQPAAASQAA